MFFVFIFSFFQFIYAQSKQDEQSILLIMENQSKSWNEADLQGFMQGYWNSDSLVFIGKSGPNYGWKNTLENYKKSYPDKKAMGILKFSDLKINFLAKGIAFVIGHWELTRENDKPNGTFSLVWKKINSKWLIISDHSS